MKRSWNVLGMSSFALITAALKFMQNLMVCIIQRDLYISQKYICDFT